MACSPSRLSVLTTTKSARNRRRRQSSAVATATRIRGSQISSVSAVSFMLHDVIQTADKSDSFAG